MRSLGKGLCLAAVLALCLLAAGCGTARADAGDPEDAVPVTVLDYAAFPDLGGVETVSVSAGFLTEDGESLSEGTVRLRVGETGADFPLDSAGELRVSGLPRQGTVELTLLDGGAELGSMTIYFSEGAVIDASMDEAGAGYVTTRADTEAVTLTFTLEGGGLRCALRLGG